MDRLNALGAKREPFVFICDYKKEQIVVEKIGEVKNIQYYIDGFTNTLKTKSPNTTLLKSPIDFTIYQKKFDSVLEEIKAGNTYLLNLTQPTPIEINTNLGEIYNNSSAKFKVHLENNFVCFSPERFIKIEDNQICTSPMKGTIKVTPTSKEALLENPKELAEHTMVVDLLRNDLNLVARDVRVANFRYVTKINSGEDELYQTSSDIVGELGEDWHSHIGDILDALLPAGSITGTPKKSTVQIIEQIEAYERGFFSGVFGYYDGERLDSGVMIRFIEKKGSDYLFKSGGGITAMSDVRDEYQEMIDKVYVSL